MNITNPEGQTLTLAELSPQTLRQADHLTRWYGYSIKPRTNCSFWILNQKFRCLPAVKISGRNFYPIENTQTLQFVFSDPDDIFFNAATLLVSKGGVI